MNYYSNELPFIDGPAGIFAPSYTGPLVSYDNISVGSVYNNCVIYEADGTFTQANPVGYLINNKDIGPMGMANFITYVGNPGSTTGGTPGDVTSGAAGITVTGQFTIPHNCCQINVILIGAGGGGGGEGSASNYITYYGQSGYGGGFLAFTLPVIYGKSVNISIDGGGGMGSNYGQKNSPYAGGGGGAAGRNGWNSGQNIYGSSATSNATTYGTQLTYDGSTYMAIGGNGGNAGTSTQDGWTYSTSLTGGTTNPVPDNNNSNCYGNDGGIGPAAAVGNAPSGYTQNSQYYTYPNLEALGTYASSTIGYGRSNNGGYPGAAIIYFLYNPVTS